MAVRFDESPPANGIIRRSNPTALAIAGGALGLALAAALAAQLGVPKAQPLVGAIALLGIAFAFSTDRPAIDLRTVARGLTLPEVFALLALKPSVRPRVLATLAAGITKPLGLSSGGAAV